MDGINCLWKTGDIYLLVTWRYVVTRSKILLSEEQLQLARKCDWISLRADIICFVRQPVFLKFRSRKLNARKFVPQTNLRAYNLHREIHATRRARNNFLGLWRDGWYKLPVKNQKYIPFGYVTLCCTAVENIMSEEQLQLARKRDWISLRADIICFVSWTVFLMFRSRKFAYFEEQIIFMDKFTSIYFQAKERLFCLSFFKYYYVKTFYWVRIWPCSVAFFDSIAWTKNCSLLSLVIHKSNTLYHLRSTTRGISGDTFHLFREKTKSCDVLKAVAREQKIFDGWTSS